MSTYRRLPAGLVCASVPAPLALALVRTVPWETVAVRLAQNPEALEAARYGWAQLEHAGAEWQHYVRGDLVARPAPAGARAAWLDTTAAGEAAGVSARTIRTWCREGYLEHVDDHGRLLVEPGSLAEHLARRAGGDFPDAEAGNLSAA